MTKPVTVTIPHGLTKAEAVRRIQNGLLTVRPQLASFAGSIEDQWDGDRMAFRMSVLRQTVSGRIDVMDETVRVEVDLPWILARLAEKVRGQIQDRGVKMLTGK